MPVSHFKKDLFWLVTLCFILFGFRLGAFYYLTPDEARYVDVAREMAMYHHWITPRLDGTPFLDKPILFYWIEILIIKTLGLHEWSIRFLPVCFATFACAMNYYAGVRLFNRRVGLLSAGILMSSTLFFIAAHYTNMDLMVASLISCSLWLFLIWATPSKDLSSSCDRAANHRIQPLIYAYVFAALAFLTKGLIAIAFPSIIILAWMLCFKQWKLLLKMKILTGLLIILAINLPWFLMVQHRNPEFYNYFFYVQQFLRFRGASHYAFNMANPPYYYLEIIVAGMIPWSLFILQAFVSACQSTVRRPDIAIGDRQDPVHHKTGFILLWIILITVFFSIPTSKTPGYIIPVLPAVAMLIAIYLSQRWNSLKQIRELKITTLVYSFVFLAGMVFAWVSPLSAQIPKFILLPSMMVLCMSMLTLNFLAFKTQKSKAYFIAFFIFQALFLWSLIGPLKTVFNAKSIYPIAAIIHQDAGSNDVLVEYFHFNYDLLMYTNRDVKVVYNWDDPNIVNDDSWHRELAEDILFKHGDRQPNLLLPNELPPLWHQTAHRVFLVTDPGSMSGLENQLGTVYLLKTMPREVLLSNEPSS